MSVALSIKHCQVPKEIIAFWGGLVTYSSHNFVNCIIYYVGKFLHVPGQLLHWLNEKEIGNKKKSKALSLLSVIKSL